MKPLSGIRVLDLTRVVSGPFCTMQLGDMGADIIKIEEPDRGDDTRAFGPPFVSGEAAYYLSVNRSKRSCALNLKCPEAAQIIRRLVEESDIFVENFRPGTAERLGFGYETVRSWNDRIIYCSISAFGVTGPERDRPGYDLVVQGASGLMDITGASDGPPTKVGTPIADLVTGLYATQAILLALRTRDASGSGQFVEIAMVDAMSSLLTFNASMYFATGITPKRRGNAHATIVPYETFQAADGWINIAVANDSLWLKFCDCSGLSHLADDPRFATAPARVQNRLALIPMVSEAISKRPRAAWVSTFEKAGVPCGEIRSVAEVCTNPALIERGQVTSLDHPTIGPLPLLNSPIRFSGAPASLDTHPPLLGEHTREILTTLAHLRPEDVDALANRGAIKCA